MKYRLSATISAGAVAMLVAGISLSPALSLSNSAYGYAPEETKTEVPSQSFVSSSSAEPIALDRGSYSATTLEEVQAIQAARAEEEAKAKAAEEAAAKAKAAATAGYNVKLAPKMNGQFAWPVTDYHIWDWESNGFQTSGRPDHNGLDMLAPALTPIYTAHDGTITTSSESYGAYGVGVVVTGTVDGQQLSTTYAHMTYGTRAVNVGDTVTAGQLIGLVGSTGRSTANHLHFEVRINGSLVDPYSWLMTNLG